MLPPVPRPGGRTALTGRLPVPSRRAPRRPADRTRSRPAMRTCLPFLGNVKFLIHEKLFGDSLRFSSHPPAGDRLGPGGSSAGGPGSAGVGYSNAAAAVCGPGPWPRPTVRIFEYLNICHYFFNGENARPLAYRVLIISSHFFEVDELLDEH